MIRLVRWLFVLRPKFNPQNGCKPRDLALILRMADLLDSKDQDRDLPAQGSRL